MKKLLIVVLVPLMAAIAGCGKHETEQSYSGDTPTSNLPVPPDFVETLEANNSSLEHWHVLESIGERMIALHYSHKAEGGALDWPTFYGMIPAGVSHIYVPDDFPYAMEWRITAIGVHVSPDPNCVPVSFLKACYEGRFDHSMALAVSEEFRRVTVGAISVDDIDAVMREVEQRLRVAQQQELPLIGRWHASSDVWYTASVSNTAHKYAVRIDISEWPADPPINDADACEVVVYFVYLPPNRDVDLSKVTAGGFG